MTLHTSTEHQELARVLSSVLSEVSAAVGSTSADELSALVHEITAAQRVFVLGLGRSGLALKMFAMRLMHLGYETYVVGETTTPAIGEGDLLVTASGSGTTGGVVAAADKARAVGARVAVLTTALNSPLAHLADQLTGVPAAQKTDHSGSASLQYAGSLFEQALLLLCDSVFHRLWERSQKSGEELWPHHANLE